LSDTSNHRRRSPFASVSLTAVCREEQARVWDALTATETPLSFLNGLIAASDWERGSGVSMRVPGASGGGPAFGILRGEVLSAERPHRLSYTLGEHPAAPSVYVTWQLCRRDGSTIIRLFVDEPGSSPGCHDELELIWLRILSSLIKHLDGPGLPVDHWD